jgi:hypothetical protein
LPLQADILRKDVVVKTLHLPKCRLEDLKILLLSGYII